MLGHVGEPIGFDRLNVSVQKEQPGTLGLLDGEIVDRRMIERPFIMQQSVFGPAEVSARPLRLAIVADNNDLIIRIACSGRDALDTAREQLHAITRRNNDGNFLCLGKFPLYPISVRGPVDGDVTLDALSPEVLVNGAPSGFELPRFLPKATRAGACAAPPMVEHPRNVMNPIGLLDGAEEEIVILRAIELGTEPADPQDDLAPYGNKMAEVIAG